MTRGTSSISRDAAAAWDSLRRMAAQLNRAKPGTGDVLLQRAIVELKHIEDTALAPLCNSQS